MYKSLIYLNSGDINLTLPSKNIPSIVTFYHKFMVNQVQTKDAFDKFKTQTKEVIEMLRYESLKSSLSKAGNEIAQMSNDEDIDDFGDQAYYDTLDDEAKDVYNMIKTTLQNQDANAQESDQINKEIRDTVNFKKKTFLIWNIKALNIDINDRINSDVSIDKSKDHIDYSDSMINVMMKSIDLGALQTVDSNSVSLLTQEFEIKHKGTSIWNAITNQKYEQSSESNYVSEDIYDDEEMCGSSSKFALNYALSVSFVQNIDEIIKTDNVLEAKITLIKIKLTPKVIQDMLELYPKNLSRLLKNKKVPKPQDHDSKANINSSMIDLKMTVSNKFEKIDMKTLKNSSMTERQVGLIDSLKSKNSSNLFDQDITEKSEDDNSGKF